MRGTMVYMSQNKNQQNSHTAIEALHTFLHYQLYPNAAQAVLPCTQKSCLTPMHPLIVYHTFFVMLTFRLPSKGLRLVLSMLNPLPRARPLHNPIANIISISIQAVFPCCWPGMSDLSYNTTLSFSLSA